MEPHTQNPDVPHSRAPNAERSAADFDAMVDAAPAVPTTTLARRGVARVRILSESQLHSLLSSAQDPPPWARAPDPGVPEPSAHDGTAPGEPDGGAERVRALHAASLAAIEGRMGRLSHAFEAIAEALRRLDDIHRDRPRHPAGGGIPSRRLDLLKEMLL
jgi:hypothetical protein